MDISKRVVMVVTFLLTLALPVQQAILIGVFLSFMDYIYSASKLVQLYELRPIEDGLFMVETPPAELPDNKITILHARGSTYFAAARTLQELMPTAKKAQNAVVMRRSAVLSFWYWKGMHRSCGPMVGD